MVNWRLCSVVLVLCIGMGWALAAAGVETGGVSNRGPQGTAPASKLQQQDRNSYCSVGHGHGVNLPSPGGPCSSGQLLMNFDGSAENGYSWQYGGLCWAGNGSFAECLQFNGAVCCIELRLTGVGYPCRPCDLYVWDDGGGVPGNVLARISASNPCPVATWPTVSTHDFPIPATPVHGPFWVGMWTPFIDQPCGYFVVADTNGFGGCPMTFIAPNLGFPSGWQNAEVVWGPTQSLGIGAFVGSCVVPTEESSWGRIKGMYR